MLELRLLGPLEIRDGDRTLTVARQKPRALLALLALNAGRVVSRDRLVDELWGDEAPKTARHALENYVSQLRKLVGDALVTQPPGYVLRIDPDVVDAIRLERLVRGSAEELREALALFRGAPLEDVDAPFAAGEVQRLAELELDAREALAEASLEAGLQDGLVTELERLVARDPYRENLRALLMLALYREGRQADALAAYRAARTTLADDLGLDPGEELQELERAILRQDPSLRGPVTARTHAAEPSPRRAGRKTVTVAVVEIAGKDPEAVRPALDEVVERHGGTLQGHVAVFGVPTLHEDDALRAVRAAAELRGLEASARIGVATGEVYVDTEQSVTGEPLGRAHELVREAGPGEIVLALETLRLLGDAVAMDDGRLVELRADTTRTLRLDSPLVGRERQLQALGTSFAAVAADRTSHLFTVLGEAGVGKSRLVQEFVDRLGERATVVRGRASAYGAAELPELGSLDALERPLVVCLDDLHWAEPAFLDLVEQLAGSRAAPILLVCIARPELLETRAGWAGGKVNASSVLLEPLSAEESSLLIDNLLGPSDLPDIVREWIVDTAEGNPLFVEEMLASLVDRNVLRPSGAGWTTVEMPALSVPPSVQALIAARVDRLPGDERTVLELASIEGTRFARDSVATLAPEELRDRLDALLAALVRKELLRPRDGGYAFRHQLVRDVAYDALSKRDRAALHERFAELADPAEAGFHRDRAAALAAEIGA
jgi:DNA-binding SARP family transcriptional activator